MGSNVSPQALRPSSIPQRLWVRGARSRRQLRPSAHPSTLRPSTIANVSGSAVRNRGLVPPGPSAAAEISPTVKIIGPFPADSHPAIVYPVAATLTAKPEAVDYLAFLRSITTKAIFEQYGFTFLIQPTS